MDEDLKNTNNKDENIVITPASGYILMYIPHNGSRAEMFSIKKLQGYNTFKEPLTYDQINPLKKREGKVFLTFEELPELFDLFRKTDHYTMSYGDIEKEELVFAVEFVEYHRSIIWRDLQRKKSVQERKKKMDENDSNPPVI